MASRLDKSVTQKTIDKSIGKTISNANVIESAQLDIDGGDSMSGGSKGGQSSKLTKGETAGLNHDIYSNLVLEDCVSLKPADLNSKIDEIILKRLKEKVEGRCIKPGFLMPNSIKIISRSLGKISNSNFNGNTEYKVNYSADVCSPSIGQIVQCTVSNIDKVHVICYIEHGSTSPVEIYLYKSHHNGNVDFSLLKDGDIINVKIAGNRYKFRDTQIIAIAQFLDKAG
jgi:DNA-directed RNA polymerase subunit E'/Rpb7